MKSEAKAVGRAGEAAHGSRSSVLVAVLLLSLSGWLWLVLSVAAGGRVADTGFGMVALAPLLDRVGAALGTSFTFGQTHAMAAWGLADLLAALLMWSAMVLAMMLPTAVPAFRAYRRADLPGFPIVAGYTAVWMSIAAAAAAGQAGLVALGALAPHMAPAGVALSASVLIAAGIYQFTPLKMACLIRCRNPHAAFVSGGGTAAAFRIGLEEGLACLGCCWALMAVMFAAGLMNLVAMAFLGMLMGIEKVVSGVWLSYVMGAVLLLLGLALAGGSYIG